VSTRLRAVKKTQCRLPLLLRTLHFFPRKGRTRPPFFLSPAPHVDLQLRPLVESPLRTGPVPSAGPVVPSPDRRSYRLPESQVPPNPRETPIPPVPRLGSPPILSPRKGSSTPPAIPPPTIKGPNPPTHAVTEYLSQITHLLSDPGSAIMRFGTSSLADDTHSDPIPSCERVEETAPFEDFLPPTRISQREPCELLMSDPLPHVERRRSCC